MSVQDELQTTLSTVGAVFDQLGVAWAIGGSFASTVYGEPRATNDVAVVARLGTRGHRAPEAPPVSARQQRVRPPVEGRALRPSPHRDARPRLHARGGRERGSGGCARAGARRGRTGSGGRTIGRTWALRTGILTTDPSPPPLALPTRFERATYGLGNRGRSNDSELLSPNGQTWACPLGTGAQTAPLSPRLMLLTGVRSRWRPTLPPWRGTRPRRPNATDSSGLQSVTVVIFRG